MRSAPVLWLACLAASCATPREAPEPRGIWCNGEAAPWTNDWTQVTNFDLVPVSRRGRAGARLRLERSGAIEISAEEAYRLTRSAHVRGPGPPRDRFHLVRGGALLPPDLSPARVNATLASTTFVQIHWSPRLRALRIDRINALGADFFEAEPPRSPQAYDLPMVLITFVGSRGSRQPVRAAEQAYARCVAAR